MDVENGIETEQNQSVSADRVRLWLIEAVIAEGKPGNRESLMSLWCLSPKDTEAVLPLLEFIDSQQADGQVMALRFLGMIGPGAKLAVAKLRTMLSSSNVELQQWSADTLGRIGAPAKIAVPQIRDLLELNDTFAKVLATGALLKLEAIESVPALNYLAETRTDPSIVVQCWALSSIIEVLALYEEAVPILMRYLDHYYDPQRYCRRLKDCSSSSF